MPPPHVVGIVYNSGMSDLKRQERIKLERLLQMDGGYVLNFSNRTFDDFVVDVTGRDPRDDKYAVNGTSKANRLRAFWEIESNFLAAKLIDALIDHEQKESPGDDEALCAECRRIAARLADATSVCEVEALAAAAAEPDFETLSRQVLDAVEKNQPEAGLDRLHTFVVKFVRARCEEHGLATDREKPLHSIFGEYVKLLREQGHLESPMTDRILRSTISVLQEFNHVRNEQSLAHDNKVLNYEESRLIFNNVTNLIRFLQALEAEIRKEKPRDVFDVPF
jgi:Abortive infection C-terminus